MKLLVLLSVVAACAASFDNLSEVEALELLKTWNLHHAFADSFQDFHVDGYTLSKLTKEHIDSDFADVASMHRQSLWSRIEDARAPERRNLATINYKVPLNNKRGLAIKVDNSYVSWGKASEIVAYRAANGVLRIVAPKGIEFVTPSIKQNGKALGGGGGNPGPGPIKTFKPAFSDFQEGGFNNGENGGRDSGNTGKCKGGDWVNKGTYWSQPSCNNGANWFINKKLKKATYDYEFSLDSKNRDNDDSGVVFRFKDKNNFIRFHHTIQNQYNNGGGSKGQVKGCTGIGSFLVVRKAGKEYCAKKTNWKYTQNKYHTFRIVSKPSTRQVKIWVDGKVHMDVTLPTQWNLKVGTFGIFVAWSQIDFKNVQYKAPAPKPCVCAKLMKPVCGSNKKDYGNACLAKCDGVTKTTPGKCFKTVKPKFSDFQEGGFNNGENGGRDSGNTGKCKGGDWVNKGSYWAQPSCNTGANWFINKPLKGATYDYTFQVDQKNRDNDDSGFVFRFQDKNNFIRFHHTIQNQYNNGGDKKVWVKAGCNGIGSFLVVRKKGKEYCVKKTNWKYSQNKYHKFKVQSTPSNGKAKIWIDGKVHMDITFPKDWNLKAGTFGIFVAWSQIEFKNVQYTIPGNIQAPKTVKPKFKDFIKGAFKNGESGSRDGGNTGKCLNGGDWVDKKSYWDQPTCNSGGSWFIAKALRNSKLDYTFSVDIKNRDNDDSGVVFRFQDKNNFYRFHHTLNNMYNKNTKGGIAGGCTSKLGSYFVARKAGKEYCVGEHAWKYAQNKYHTYTVLSRANGRVKIYADSMQLFDLTVPTKQRLTTGTVGIFLSYSQVQVKNFKYTFGSSVRAPATFLKTYKPAFSDFKEGGFNNGENGGRDSGNTGKCKGGDWVNKGSYWSQPSCNTGANWFINKKMMDADYNYEFSADQKNRDNDDSGFVFRFKDKNNFIRFHHTIQNQYNNGGGSKGQVKGCTGIGSFLVVRKAGKEYCAKKTNWKYTQNKFHNFRISTNINGKIKIWIDGKVHMDVTLSSQWNLKVGTFGIFVAWSQIDFKNVQYKIQALKEPVVPRKTVVPKFKDFTKGAFKNGESGSRDGGNTGKCVTGDWADKKSYWDQASCNSGGGWFINKDLMDNKVDYQFSVDIKNRDNDDSGVVFRFKDKNNFIRFHHTLNNMYNKNTKGGIAGGCTSKLGSYLVVRKAGKEYCMKEHDWKYKQNKFHKITVMTRANGQIVIWVDGNMLINAVQPTNYRLTTGTAGIFISYSQIQFKNFKYTFGTNLPKLGKKSVTAKPAFSDFQEGGFNNGENGGRESGNTGKCKGGDWVNKGSYWAQPSCNTGANWFISKSTMGASYDYTFQIDQKNRDNDDSGFVFRFKDKNNFIRFHHTIQNQYNSGGDKKVWVKAGCNGIGSFLVVRKGGKEYCVKKTNWKYSQNKYHRFKVQSTPSNGKAKIWIDGKVHMDITFPKDWNLKVGTYGIFVAWSQIEFKGVQITYQASKPL